MDTYEATKIVLSRIQSLDQEHASKIMGFILIQDLGEKNMIRLAFGTDAYLLGVINEAKACLGLLSNTSPAQPFNPPRIDNPFPYSPSPRIIIPNNNGFQTQNPSSPSSPWSSVSGLSPRPHSSLSYAAVVNGTAANNSGSGSFSPSSTSPFPFFSNNNNSSNCGGDLTEEIINNGGVQVQDHLTFLDEKNMEFMDPIMSPGGRSDSALFPVGSRGSNWVDSDGMSSGNHHHIHRRSSSVSDAFLGGSDDVGGGGFDWRPCMYYAKGFCKNGSSCKFLHGSFSDSFDGSTAIVGGSPGNFDGFDKLLRMKAIQQQQQQQQQQQRLAAASQFMAAAAPFQYSNNKCMNFLNDDQRSAAAALMMGEEFHKFVRCRPERNDFAAMGLGGNANSSSCQIYLTFPADSTFKEEDVSNYFSIYGPVQDVRIPYQQKRMFGFVTFVYPETVNAILAKGNPHFVCDSRVLVKPYKEKGKVPDKKQHRLMEEREFSAFSSPSGLDAKEPFDRVPFGARMFYNTQEMMLRRKLEEQADLEQAIEYEGRRLANFQLTDIKNPHNRGFDPSFSAGVLIPSPTQSHIEMQSLVLLSDGVDQQVPEENNVGKDGAVTSLIAEEKVLQEVNEAGNDHNGNNSGSGNCKEVNSSIDEADFNENSSLEHILPDNLFASPTKLAGDHQTIFSAAPDDDSGPITTTSSNSIPVLPTTTSALNMASLNSCYFQMPRFSSGQEAINM